jgi:hypothetical protein
MAEPWENLEPLETALVTTDLIADLSRRMFLVAKVRAEAVQRMKAEGSTVRAICKELGLSRYVVCSLLKMSL